MKNSHTLATSTAVALACAATFAPMAARADATVAFTINNRPGLVPAASVRWSFALNAAAVNGVTSVSITEPGQAPVVATLGGGPALLPSGDLFRLDRATTMVPASPNNGVSLLYTALSHFNAGDFCNLKAGTLLPKAVTLSFSGPTITDHAIGTYTVAGTTAASTYFCQQAKRRVSSAPAGVTTPPPAPAPALAKRLPLDVILVLDKSGSMGSGLPGGPAAPPSRWDALKTALDQFVGLWEQASEAGVVGDRLGLVHFDSTAKPADFGGGSIFQPRSAWAGLLTAAKDPAGADTGGATAIGPGLNSALSNWTANPANFDAVVILMTDGEQNRAPLLAKIGGTDWGLAAAGVPVAGLDELYRKGLPIQTIGFGTPAALEADMLGGIAEQTAGTSIVTATDTGLAIAMQDVLVKALKGNTLGLLARTEGTVLPPGVGAPIALQVDPSVARVTVVLSWKGRRNLFDLLMQSPGGTPTVPTIRTQGDGWLIASVDVPTNGPSGEWRAIVRGNDLSSPANFQLSAYAVDVRLKYDLGFARGTVGTGDSIPLAVTVVHDGAPLAGIAGGIRLRPAKPAEGVGNILHAAAAGPQPTDPDQSATTAKALALAQNANLIGRTSPTPTGQTITLVDDGTGGDAMANDGIYTATVTDTRVPGRYQFDLALEWDDPRTGKVRRLESVQRNVEATPAAAQTVVTVRPPADGRTTIQITPRDRFGNFVGPGFGSVVQVTVKNAPAIVGPVRDPAQTGDYLVDVTGIPPGSSPTIDIAVDGKPVRTDMPVVPGTTGGGSGKYAIWTGAGRAIPQGSFANTHKTGPAVALGFEVALNNALSVEATLSGHGLKGKGANVDVDVTQLGVNGKLYFTPGPMRLFATAGVGAYDFDPGSTRVGASLGAGVQYQLTSNWALEGRYALHSVANNAPQARHSTWLLALRYAF